MTILFEGAVLAATRTEIGGWKWTDLPPGWVLTLAAIALFLFFRAIYRRERGRAPRPTRWALAAVRTVVLLLLILVLAGPYREEVRTAEERSHLVLLVDTSGSMGTTDRYPESEQQRLRDALPPGDTAPVTETSRLDLLKKVLAPEGESLLRDLERRFVLHAYAFDVDWRGLGVTHDDSPSAAESRKGDAVRDIGDAIRSLEASGGGTDIGGVLKGVASEFLGREDRRLAGVLLFSDGRDTGEGEKPLEVLTSLPLPLRRDLHVSAVAMGNPSTGRNARVERIRAKDVVLVDDDVVIETAIRHQGFRGVKGVKAVLQIDQVADADNRPIVPPRSYRPPPGTRMEIDGLELGDPSEPVPVRFQVRMQEAGSFRVSVRVVLPPEEAKEDAVREDDVSTHNLRVVDQQIKVLYVDNLPRYELRFLSNWLTREPPTDRTRPQHRRRYDVHVLQQSRDPTVDQPASLGLTPLKRFPSERRDLFAYDVIILGDIDWMKLGETAQESRRILGLIRDFVEEGGGLALEAGEDYQNPLGFRDTPLQELLPISPRDRDRNVSEPPSLDVPIHIDLTDAGRLYPVFAVVPGPDGGVAKPDDIARGWAGKAPYSRDWEWYWMYRATGGLRPGAIALARADPTRDRDQFLDETGQPDVIFATLGYGKGRVFFSALDSIWRIRRGHSDRYYGPFWDQLIRQLATYRLLGGNRRFKISTDKESYFAGESATVTITALDRDYAPLEDARLDGVHVESPDGQDTLLEGDERPLNASSEGAAPGTFRKILPLRKTGTWRIWMGEPEPQRGPRTEARAEKRVEVVFRAAELRKTIPDHDLLQKVVTETDGQLVNGHVARLYELKDLAATLPDHTTQRVLDRGERTQWDKPWVLLLLVGLLALEWALRKRWQMI